MIITDKIEYIIAGPVDTLSFWERFTQPKRMAS
jgi:hypothetical protein